MPRRTDLTPAVQKRIVDAIKGGNYYEAAAAAGGVDYATFRRWMVRGEDEDDGLYRAFRDAVIEAEAEAEVDIVKQWRSAIPQDWKAARDFLARRQPKRWGPRERHEHSGPDGGPITFADMLAATRRPDTDGDDG